MSVEGLERHVKLAAYGPVVTDRDLAILNASIDKRVELVGTSSLDQPFPLPPLPLPLVYGIPMRYRSPVGAGTPPAGSSVTATATGGAMSAGVM